MRPSYYRAHVLLKEQMKGYSMTDREATGYCKMDVRGERGKAHLFVQNLRSISVNTVYGVYFIIHSPEQSIGVYVGVLGLSPQGKGELRWDFSPSQIGDSPYTIEDIGAVAVLIPQEERPGYFICPLIGFVDEPFQWQTNFTIWEKDSKNTVLNEKMIEEEQTLKNHTIEKNEVENIQKKEDFFQKEKNLKITKDIKEKQEKDSKITKNIEEEQERDSKIAKNIENEQENDSEAIRNIEKEKMDEIIKEIVEEKQTEDDFVGFNFDFSVTKDEKSLALIQHWEEKELESVFLICPPMSPFENPNLGKDWVRITPKEIALLPLPTWSFIHHPLVVEGYYRYHHLLLGKGDDLFPSIILGVPGQYYPQYEPLAYQNGFSHFYCCRDIGPRTGEYGYWIVKIHKDL